MGTCSCEGAPAIGDAYDASVDDVARTELRGPPPGHESHLFARGGVFHMRWSVDARLGQVMVGGDEWGAVGVASHKRVMIDQSRFNQTIATFHRLSVTTK